MQKLYLFILSIVLVLPSNALPTDSLQTGEHVSLAGVALSDSLPAIISALEQQEMQLVDIDSARHNVFMSGAIGNIEMLVDISTDKSMQRINHIQMSSPKGDDRNQRADYHALFEWLCGEYGRPDWSGTVRSHHFSRWFFDFDRDVILIATGSGNVEIWFYENHTKRNIDYYSILKYCEKNPAAEVPMLSAAEQITWKRADSVGVRRHVATRHKKRTALRKRTAAKKKRSGRRRASRRRR
jgi:hypothetical protein